jgi:hypothetical protein
MDITETTAPRSDQQNFDDYATTSRTVTVSEVRAGTAEQPVEIHLVEFPGRPFKPSKTVRRILVAAWGPEASNYVGRRMTLYGDPTIKFGGQVVGGIRVSHLSHIDKKLTLHLTSTRGKRSPHVIEPLPAGPPLITDDQAAEIADKITRADDRAALDEIGVQLKGFDLGAHKADLQGLWKSRAGELAGNEGQG